ncbi:hypothetical protein [Candidatus Hydrogenosomobacter endosymbioticus]|nr:hypothetical protein [Candidatus Hydrogenosomobacter endosymbioticus]
MLFLLLSLRGEVGVVEWIDIDDPMVRVLLKNRENVFSGGWQCSRLGFL